MTGQELVRMEQARTRARANQLWLRLKKALAAEVGLQLIRLPQSDQLQLFRLEQMARQEGVTFEEAATELVIWWAERMKRMGRRRRPNGLPVRTWTLVGQHSRKVLKEKVQQKYPGGENWDVRREESRELALRRKGLAQTVLRVKPEGYGPGGFARRYKTSVVALRREREEAIREIRQAARPYRGRLDGMAVK